MNIMNDNLPSDINPELDPSFTPAAVWTRNFARLCTETNSESRMDMAIERPDGTVYRHSGLLLPESDPDAEILNLRHVERLLKFLLWQKGGQKILISAPQELVRKVSDIYAPRGSRSFDSELIGEKVFGAPISIEYCHADDLPKAHESALPLGRHLDGCRIGFDLGGSDRKAAAVIDGKVIFSEEIAWDPYFQADINYHYEGIQDSLKRAAAHLPRVDAIGGSAAGIYVHNEVRLASLFRGIPEDRFAEDAVGIFKRVRAEWGNIPFDVINDGDVTAIAGSLSLGNGAVLGIAMGTSLAAGYCDAQSHITGWLNELAFTPEDYRKNAPIDEWSRDDGCGVQYFSQQAVGRLAPVAGFEFAPDMPLPEQLKAVQEAMQAEDPRASAIYRTIGCYLGYSVAHYSDFYDIDHLLLMGRVMSGAGGEIIINTAEELLKTKFPGISEEINITTPDEKMRRHGQAIAAASLPSIQ